MYKISLSCKLIKKNFVPLNVTNTLGGWGKKLYFLFLFKSDGGREANIIHFEEVH